MPYLIEVIIIFILLLTGIFVGFYHQIDMKSNDVNKSWRGIEKLLKLRETILKDFLDASPKFLENENNLFLQIREKMIQCKSSNDLQDIVDSSFQLSDYLERLISQISIQEDEGLKDFMDHLEEIENKITLSWYEYNTNIYDFNQWISRAPQKAIATILGIEALKYIIFEEE